MFEAIEKFTTALHERLENGDLPDTLPDRCCNECDGNGWIEVDGTVKRCVTSKRRIIRRIIGNYPRFQDYYLADCFEKNSIVESSREVALGVIRNTKPIGRVHCSGYGRGKTTSAKAIMVEMFMRGYEWFAEVNFPQMIEWYKQGYDRQDDIDRWFERISQSKFVHVDEYGLEKDTDQLWKHQAMHRILDLCLHKRFLIISTNLNKSKFIESLHPRDCDRLRPQDGYFKIIEDVFDGDMSYRKRGE